MKLFAYQPKILTLDLFKIIWPELSMMGLKSRFSHPFCLSTYS